MTAQDRGRVHDPADFAHIRSIRLPRRFRRARRWTAPARDLARLARLVIVAGSSPGSN